MKPEIASAQSMPTMFQGRMKQTWGISKRLSWCTAIPGEWFGGVGYECRLVVRKILI